jgi:hypothetical protein
MNDNQKTAAKKYQDFLESDRAKKLEQDFESTTLFDKAKQLLWLFRKGLIRHERQS